MPKDELREIVQAPNVDLIAHIENLLERAKSGEIQAVFEVVVFENGNTANGCSFKSWHENRMSIIIAEIHLMLIRLVNHSTGIYKDIDLLKEITNAP